MEHTRPKPGLLYSMFFPIWHNPPTAALRTPSLCPGHGDLGFPAVTPDFLCILISRLSRKGRWNFHAYYWLINISRVVGKAHREKKLPYPVTIVWIFVSLFSLPEQHFVWILSLMSDLTFSTTPPNVLPDN